MNVELVAFGPARLAQTAHESTFGFCSTAEDGDPARQLRHAAVKLRATIDAVSNGSLEAKSI